MVLPPHPPYVNRVMVPLHITSGTDSYIAGLARGKSQSVQYLLGLIEEARDGASQEARGVLDWLKEHVEKWHGKK